MKTKKTLYKWFMIGFILFISSNSSLANDNSINALVLYLADHDIIITQNTKDNKMYEGYDFIGQATYKILVNETFEISDFTIDIMDTTYEKLDFDKIIGLKWFAASYLEKNEEFLKDIKQVIRDTPDHYSEVLDLGEWKVNLLVFPLQGGKLNLSLHFMDDATQGKRIINENAISALKDIYKELGCIETVNSTAKSSQLSYKLPYHKLNVNESIYYNSFFNQKNLMYKTQFIFYKNGFDFQHKDIPQIKQIIGLVTNIKNYPFDKLDIQFNNLKEDILSNENRDNKSISGWDYGGFKTIMDIERYANRDECRIKITVYLVKK